MKNNYWYSARPNELFIDTDKMSKSIEHTKKRLQGAMECERLDVARIFIRQSASGKDHCHIIITLNQNLCPFERYAWEIILHSDIYRGCSNIMRSVHGIPAPDVLISPHPYFGFGIGTRYYDDKCQCENKHDAAQMAKCEAAKRLRGEYRTKAFFGKPSKNQCVIWPVTP